MTDKHLHKEIDDLRKQIAVFKKQEAANIQRQDLLRALSQASLSISKVIKPGDIFDKVAEALNTFGYSCAIYLITHDQKHITVRAISYDTKAIEAAEKLAGQTVKGFK